MRYRLISDIHSELWPENPFKAGKHVDRLLPAQPEDAETVLLLAGDTGSYRRRNLYRAVIERLCDRFRIVLDIPGNHFWYGGTDWQTDTPSAERSNYRFGSTLTACGVVAATLWADFNGGDRQAERDCVEGMNDFRQIPGLSPAMVRQRHAEHVRFLRDHIEPGGIVMTHFAPSRRSIPATDAAHPCNPYYASDLEALILETRPALWLHGHIHTAADYRIGDTRVVCNPAGYEGRDHQPRLSFEQ